MTYYFVTYFMYVGFCKFQGTVRRKRYGGDCYSSHTKTSICQNCQELEGWRGFGNCDHFTLLDMIVFLWEAFTHSALTARWLFTHISVPFMARYSCAHGCISIWKRRRKSAVVHITPSLPAFLLRRHVQLSQKFTVAWHLHTIKLQEYCLF